MNKCVFSALLCFVCFLGLKPKVLAQSSINQGIADLIAAFIENSGEEGEFDFNTLYEEYELLADNPINLNTATRTDLQELFFLSDIQISNLIEHRNVLGKLNRIHELQTISGFDLLTIQLLRDISTVVLPPPVTKKSFRSDFGNADHRVYLKWKRQLQTQDGFKSKEGNPPRFLGDQNHLYLRYQMTVGTKFKLGFIAEKDQGEPYFYPGKTYGADYYSFHLYAKDLTKRIKYLSIGDYAINLGQGLIMNNGFGSGKSSLTTGIRKGGYTVRAYSSVAEFNFLRGGALTYRLTDKLEWTNFISYKNRTVGLVEDLEDVPLDANFVTSLPLGGLNRTESELSRKNILQQFTAGTALKYRLKRGHIGIQGLYDQFSRPLIESNQLYQLYNPVGTGFVNASLDYGYNIRNINIFGEVAMDKNLEVAQIHGILVGLDPKFDVVFSYRDYSPRYRSFAANAFGESPVGNNERGFYGGIEFRPSKMWLINAYGDIWRNPWVRFRVDAPGTGSEYFLRIKYFKKRDWEIYGQYFYENKLRNQASGSDQAVENIRQRLRFHHSKVISKGLTLRNRVEFSWYDIFQTHSFAGFVVYQDILYKPVGENYSFNLRYAYFDINDFDARIYAYENDILNEYYIPAYNGRGNRFYINARLRATRNIMVEARYEMTRLTQGFNDENGDLINTGFGSGVTSIDGRIRSQVKAQVKLSF